MGRNPRAPAVDLTLGVQIVLRPSHGSALTLTRSVLVRG
jgi:hypothetical protein